MTGVGSSADLSDEQEDTVTVMHKTDTTIHILKITVRKNLLCDVIEGIDRMIERNTVVKI